MQSIAPQPGKTGRRELAKDCFRNDDPLVELPQQTGLPDNNQADQR